MARGGLWGTLQGKEGKEARAVQDDTNKSHGETREGCAPPVPRDGCHDGRSLAAPVERAGLVAEEESNHDRGAARQAVVRQEQGVLHPYWRTVVRAEMEDAFSRLSIGSRLDLPKKEPHTSGDHQVPTLSYSGEPGELSTSRRASA